jgi:hypothetical protein
MLVPPMRTSTFLRSRLLAPALAAIALLAACATASAGTRDASGADARAAGAPLALVPELVSVHMRGVTLTAHASRVHVRAGQRIRVSGKVAIERGAPFPFRVLVVARALSGAGAPSAHATAYVRMDGTYAATIRPRSDSDLRVIALPLRAGDHLAEAAVGRISVRARG